MKPDIFPYPSIGVFVIPSARVANFKPDSRLCNVVNNLLSLIIVCDAPESISNLVYECKLQWAELVRIMEVLAQNG